MVGTTWAINSPINSWVKVMIAKKGCLIERPRSTLNSEVKFFKLRPAHIMLIQVIRILITREAACQDKGKLICVEQPIERKQTNMAVLPRVHLHSRMVQLILANGWMACAMDMEHSSGRTVHAMKACGKMTKQTVKESLCTPMETSTRASGLTIRLKEPAPIRTPMVPTTKVSGSTINNMGKVQNLGLMALDMRASTKTERKKGKVG